ncbi:hypothetical protein B0H10DRAFT_2031169 [Mycena sp. CBHHK59/15]|nr:hypothetical protein B0H10DRAFT_2031169 [Mycena sp. CBHHK59/15]
MPPAFSLLLTAFCPSRCESHTSRASISCVQDLIHTTSSSVMLSCHLCHFNAVPSQVPKPSRHQKKAQIIQEPLYSSLFTLECCFCPKLCENGQAPLARIESRASASSEYQSPLRINFFLPQDCQILRFLFPSIGKGKS